MSIFLVRSKRHEFADWDPFVNIMHWHFDPYGAEHSMHETKTVWSCDGSPWEAQYSYVLPKDVSPSGLQD